MTQSDLDVAALVASRICHDVISPIGAINNGLELLAMSGLVPDGPEMSLINESVTNASARIRFFRIAYGAASDQEIGRSEVISVLDDMMGSGKIDVAWGPSEAQPRNLVRLAFLAIQCLETAMPYGGKIEVSCNHKQWKIHGKSEKMNDINTLWQALDASNGPAQVASSHVQFALLPIATREQNRKLELSMTNTDISIQF